MSAANVTAALADLEKKAAAGESFTRSDAERVIACTDLISIGVEKMRVIEIVYFDVDIR